MYHRVKGRLYAILEGVTPGDHTAQIFNSGVLVLIVLNVAAIIMETVEGFHDAYRQYFRCFEYISVAAFTFEYVGRLWSCNVNPRFAGHWRGRLKFAVTPMALVDLFAILPFYLPMLVVLDMRFLRILRLFRIFRIFKIARYSEALQTMANVFRRKRAELLLTFSAGGMVLIIASCLMYDVEHTANPDGVFSSIPKTMWWAVVTLTTVGYGDMVPVTLLGRVLGALIAIMGVGMIALPAGLLGSGFLEEVQNKRRRTIACPHCGKEYDLQP